MYVGNDEEREETRSDRIFYLENIADLNFWRD
jgi:hypothetical protein